MRDTSTTAVAGDATAPAMLAATAVGLSVAGRDGAVEVLRRLARGNRVALVQARNRLDELPDVDDTTMWSARALLAAAADTGRRHRHDVTRPRGRSRTDQGRRA